MLVKSCKEFDLEVITEREKEVGLFVADTQTYASYVVALCEVMEDEVGRICSTLGKL
jgi:hypothetical protein